MEITTNDYINPIDGMLYCRKCHTPKEKMICFPPGSPRQKIEIKCQCETEQKKREAQEIRKRETHLRNVRDLRSSGIRDEALKKYTFESSNDKNSDIMGKAQKYVDSWSDVYKNNTGLLLWGNTGNGKTFTAACIANALIDREIPVLITSFPRILNDLSVYGIDKNA
ncbi:MAG: ATP-binding protein, partial [Oscillospiraceae bacterium]|nr:ATP-binding protein [Oscillospiraceae bacterium]